MNKTTQFTEHSEVQGAKSNETPKDDHSGVDFEQAEAKPVDPTRFGDWEKNGRCIDF